MDSRSDTEEQATSGLPTEQEKETFISRAIVLSREGFTKGHGAPFGAVIVKDGQIIAEGYNRIAVDCDITAHGEMTAIRSACKILKSWHLSGCHIYTSCEPCAMCTSAIWFARIERIYFAVASVETYGAFDHKELNTDLTMPIEKRSIPGEQIKCKAKEARDIVMTWNGKTCYNHPR